MARDFLGTGWSFPVETDHRGNIELTSDRMNIKESIRVILGTAQGERVMRPEFGCAIHEYVFANVDVETLTLMEDAVEEALVRWEPRIDLETVEAQQDPEKPNRVLIEVEYRISDSDERDNLVYPFYVEGGPG